MKRTVLRTSRRAGGFTLLEAALTTVIVGVGVLSIVEAQQAYHQKNDWAARVGTAQSLASEIRELTMSLPFHDPLSGDATYGPEANETDVTLYDDLDDFAGALAGSSYPGSTFSPPINALSLPIADLTQWTQQVTVEAVGEFDMGGSGQAFGTSNLIRVTVDVLYQQSPSAASEGVTSLSWVVKRQG